MKPITKTAFYTCGVRMQDALSDSSVCNDSFAGIFMNEDGRQILESLEDETSPSATTLARHRLIDDFLRRQIADDFDLSVMIIGAGFDSRAYRIEGGVWTELDEPQIIEYKNARLPVSACANQLRRVPIDFSIETLAEKLADFSDGDQPAVVVVEGVFAYLDESEINRMLETLRRLFPRHKLIGDLMSRRFFEEYGRTLHEKLNGFGASFKFTVDDPEKIFLENGYRRLEKFSVVEQAVEFGLFEIPKNALEALSTLTGGNAVYIFEAR